MTPTTGDLRIPMLTLHTLGDLFVPFHMEQEYARRVEAGVKPAGDAVLDAAAPRLWDQVPALAFLKPAACPAL